MRQSLSIAVSHYFAATIADSHYVAAAHRTSLQQSLPAIAGSNFAAKISRRQLLSIAASHYLAASITRSNYVAAVANYNLSAAIAASHCWQLLRRSRLIPSQQSLQPLLAAITSLYRYDFSTAVAVSHGWQQLRRNRRDFHAAIAVYRGQPLICCSHCSPKPRRCSRYDLSAAACSNYVAAGDMTSRQQPLAAIPGTNFARRSSYHSP